MENIKDLSLAELKSILKDVRKLKDIRAKLGKRWTKTYSNLKDNKKECSVEYSSWLDVEYVKARASEVYKNVFNYQISWNEVCFKEKPSLVWGVKVYYWDSVIDLSFSSIEKKLRK